MRPGGIDVLLPSADDRLIGEVAERLGERRRRVSGFSIDTSSTRHIPKVPSSAPAALHPDYSELVRRLAAESTERFDRLCPGFYLEAIPGVELAPLVRNVLARRLAFRDVPAAIDFVVARRGSAPAPHRRWRPRATVYGLTLTTAQLAQIDLMIDGHATFEAAAFASAARLDLVRKTHKYFRRGQPGSTDELAVRLADEAGSDHLVVVGAETDLVFLLPLVQLLAPTGSVTVVRKNDRPSAERAAEILVEAGATGIVGAEERARQRGTATKRSSVASALSSVAGSYGSFSSEDATFVRHHLADLVPLIRDLLAWDVLLESTTPRLIAGAFDSSPIGATLSALQSTARLLNFQHGTVSALGADLAAKFDVSAVWNEHTRRAFVGSGSAADGVVVLGNPRWEALATPGPVPAESDTVADLKRWRAGRPLVVVFPQPEKPPFLVDGDMQRLFAWCSAALRASPDVLLLVKRRSASDLAGEATLAALRRRGRVRFLNDDEITLAEALGQADLAVSVVSAALADAIAAGVPGAALDVSGSFDALRPDFRHSVQVCRTERAFVGLIDVLGSGRVETPVRDPLFLPEFDAAYDDRLSALLVEHHLVG